MGWFTAGATSGSSEIESRKKEKEQASVIEEKIPSTIKGMERILGDISLKIEDIKVFSNLRNKDEMSELILYGNRILGRLKEFLKHENEDLLSDRMKEIKKLLEGGSGLSDIIEVFSSEDEVAA